MDNIKEQLNKVLAPLKEYWGKISEKTRKTIVTASIVVVVAAICITLVLNLTGGSYVDLYPQMTASETTQVYAILKEMPNIKISISSSGVIQVPRNKKADVMIELASRGFPQTTRTYDTFLDNSSFTMTDSEKRQVLIYQLQDDMQQTIRSIEGVDSCIVNINVVEDSGRVWEETTGESTASVVVRMKNGFRLSAERVTGIKNLVAFGIPNTQLKSENVSVIDAATGVAIDGGSSSLLGEGGEYKRLQYERDMENQIEEKIRGLLAPMYGADGVTAVCTVKLNYDKVLSENREVIPGADGKGTPTHESETFTANTGSNAGDIVGEENNTDTPGYSNLEGNENGEGVVDYNKETDYDISTRVVQTEGGQAVLEYASASILVNDPNFTAERQERLIEMVSKAVNIIPDRLSVEYFDLGTTSVGPSGNGGFSFDLSGENGQLILIIGAVVLGIILLVAIIIIILSKASKKRKRIAADEAKKAQDLLRSAQNQLEERKRSLADAAMANDTEQNGLTNDIRQFAKANPEIAASLIRSMLKEDE